MAEQSLGICSACFTDANKLSNSAQGCSESNGLHKPIRTNSHHPEGKARQPIAFGLKSIWLHKNTKSIQELSPKIRRFKLNNQIYKNNSTVREAHPTLNGHILDDTLASPLVWHSWTLFQAHIGMATASGVKSGRECLLNVPSIRAKLQPVIIIVCKLKGCYAAIGYSFSEPQSSHQWGIDISMIQVLLKIGDPEFDNVLGKWMKLVSCWNCGTAVIFEAAVWFPAQPQMHTSKTAQLEAMTD